METGSVKTKSCMNGGINKTKVFAYAPKAKRKVVELIIERSSSFVIKYFCSNSLLINPYPFDGNATSVSYL